SREGRKGGNGEPGTGNGACSARGGGAAGSGITASSCKSDRSAAARRGSESPGRAHAPGGEADGAGDGVSLGQAGCGAVAERPADRSRCEAGAGAYPPAPWREARIDP